MRAAVNPRPRRRIAIALMIAAVFGGGALAACTGSADEAAGRPEPTARAGATAAGSAAPEAAQPDATQHGATEAAATDGDVKAPGQTQAGQSESKADEGAGTKSATTAEPAPVVTEGRDIIRTGSFTMSVTVAQTDDDEADQKALRQKVNGISVRARASAAGVGGFISASEGDGVTQSITMRIPATKYDAAREALASIGELNGSESSQDVTGQLADMDGRIATMKASVTRIRQLLAKTTKISEIVALESELSDREAELEGLLRQRAALADQAALSTITLVVSGSVSTDPGTATPTDDPTIPAIVMTATAPTGFAGGLDGAYRVMTQIGSVVATFVGAALPFLAIGLLLFLVGGWIVRRLRPRAA